MFSIELNATSMESKLYNGEHFGESTSSVTEFICPILYKDVATAVGTFITQNLLLTASSYLFFLKGRMRQKFRKISPRDLKVQLRSISANRTSIYVVNIMSYMYKSHYKIKQHIHDIALLKVSRYMLNIRVLNKYLKR